MKQYLAFQNLRFGLFVSLIALTPFSKYPSVALPAYNFSSFRLGLYQILAAIFVLLCTWPTLKNLKRLFHQNRLVFVSIILLAITVVIGLVTALYKSRSALLIISILFLLSLVITTWWYVRFELHQNSYKYIMRTLLLAGILFSLAGIAQFISATFTNETFGILCNNCSTVVFGFPRINGFAAEPQFLANALLPFLFMALGMSYAFKNRLAIATLVLSAFCITLTFSRGAFVAVFAGLLIFIVLIGLNHQINVKKLLLWLLVIVVTVVFGMGTLVASASYRYRSTPNITYNTTVSMLDQLSLGVINFHQKGASSATSASSSTSSFTPSGLVESSTQDRLSAAQLALKAWRSNPYTVVFGVGAGNLGPYVDKHINSTAPNNLTVYIFYALIIAELGLIGLVSFLLLYIGSLWQFIKHIKGKNVIIHSAMAATLCAFIVQQWFFGTYINTVYIWLWIGIILGAGLPLSKKLYNQKSS